MGTGRPTFVEAAPTNGESFTVLRELKSAIPGKEQGFETEIDCRRSALGKAVRPKIFEKRTYEEGNKYP